MIPQHPSTQEERVEQSVEYIYLALRVEDRMEDHLYTTLYSY